MFMYECVCVCALQRECIVDVGPVDLRSEKVGQVLGQPFGSVTNLHCFRTN